MAHHHSHSHDHDHDHHDHDHHHDHDNSHSHDHTANGHSHQEHSHSHKPSHSAGGHRHSRNYSTNGYAFPPSGPDLAIAYAPPPPRPLKRQQTSHTPFKHEHEHDHGAGFSPAKLTTPVLLATTLFLASLSQPEWLNAARFPSRVTKDTASQLLNPLMATAQTPPLQNFSFLAGCRMFQSAGIASGTLLLGSGLRRVRGNRESGKKDHPLRIRDVLQIAGTMWTVYYAAGALGGVRTAVLVAAAVASGVMGVGYKGIMGKWGFGLAMSIALGWDVWWDTNDWTIPLGYMALLAALVFGKSAWPLEGVGAGKSATVAGVGLGVVGALGLLGNMPGNTRYGYLSVVTGAVGMVIGQGVDGQMGAGIALVTAAVVGMMSGSVWGFDIITELMLGGCAIAAIQFDKRAHDHGHSHSHGHDSHDHGHSHSDAPSKPPKEPSQATKALLKFFESRPLIHSILQDRDSRRISYFMCLNFAFMMIQTAYGFLTGSLGLISDSVHMFFDCLALAVGVCAAVMSKWPPSMRYPYGLHKMDTLAGFANGIFLMLISIEITFEAFERLRNPTPIARLTELLFVSISGLAVNMVGIFAFDHAHTHGHSHSHSHGGEGHSDNMHAIFLHILADALGSVSVVVSTVLIHYTAWPGYDPLASVLIAVLIFASSVPLVVNAAKSLLLTVSPETEYKLRDRIAGVASIKGVREYRAARFWEGEGVGVRGVLHVVADAGTDREDVKRRVEEWLEGMEVTVCVEREGEHCWCRN